MSKGLVLGGYQISNVLIAILLVASTTGAGVATDSFSGITDSMSNILPSNSVSPDNKTDRNSTGNQGDTGGQDSDQNDQGSEDGSGDGSSDSSDSDSEGFLDDILGGDEKQKDQNSDGQTDNTTEKNTDTSDNETQTPDTGNTTNTTTASIASISDPQPAQYFPAYETSSVPLYVEFSGEDANFEIWLDGQSYLTGQISGTKTVNRTLDLSTTGSHELKIEVRQSGEVVDSLTRTFEIADSAIQETGFEKTTTVRTGAEATFRLLYNGEPVSGAAVSMGGTQVGQTNQDGEITVQVPYQDTITLSTDYQEIGSQTFNVTQDIPEPTVTLVNPVDSETFDTPTSQQKDVQFNATVDIAEDSGTASLMIDGSEVYSQQLSQGENTITTTQSLAGGTHNWKIEVDTPEYNVSSSSRSLTVNEVQVQDGISLQNTPPTVGNVNYVRLYNNGEPVTNHDITINGQTYTTNSQGEAQFTVPNAQELTISSSSPDYQKTYTIEGYNPEISMSFSFSKTLYQGRQNTLTVTSDGSAVSGATIYANGKQKGQTDSSGQLTFTIPEEDSVTIKAVKDNSEKNKTYTAQIPPIDITWFGPDDGASINDYKTTFDFSLGLQSSATATLTVGGQQRLQKSLSSGTHSITKEIKFENSGTRDYTLEVQTDGNRRTKTGSFTTEQDMPPIQISISNPSSGETINDYKTTIQYGFDSPEDFNYTLSVDGRHLDSLSLLSGQTSRQAVANCLTQGQHTLEIVAKGEKTGKTTKTIQFTSSVAQPLADIQIDSPKSSETVQNPVGFYYKITACQDISYDVSTEGQNLDSGSLSAYSIALSPPGLEKDYSSLGKHNWTISVSNGSQTLKKEIMFSVE
ncbi:hypothetical protein GKQ38_04850 [Candidatus Nanohaloarchaea archaeon]|nr:hypothetical protein GKQ38_04850 [Candidatus Nanohaloarchaea archaeon]